MAGSSIIRAQWHQLQGVPLIAAHTLTHYALGDAQIYQIKCALQSPIDAFFVFLRILKNVLFTFYFGLFNNRVIQQYTVKSSIFLSKSGHGMSKDLPEFCFGCCHFGNVNTDLPSGEPVVVSHRKTGGQQYLHCLFLLCTTQITFHCIICIVFA